MDRVERAFGQISRADFLPDDVKAQAGWDSPLPIGFGQTNGQPTTVRMMLEWLQVQPGNKILDIGSGSGWTTALLAKLTGPKGRVYAVEIIPELLELGRNNCREAGINNAEFHKAGGQYGLPALAPFDRILVSAAASRLPDELLLQLNNEGKMVIPVGGQVLEVEKSGIGQVEITSHCGFAFVPLVKPG